MYSSELHEGVFGNSLTGQYTNMHWTALGKALLSQLSDDRVTEIIEERALPEATPNTITDRDELFEELAPIRDREFSIEDEECREGIKFVAPPVQHTDGTSPVSAVSIAGPRRRIGEEQINDQFLDAIMDTINVIELKNRHY